KRTSILAISKSGKPIVFGIARQTKSGRALKRDGLIASALPSETPALLIVDDDRLQCRLAHFQCFNSWMPMKGEKSTIPI
ncbi:MAG: hypothetical protein DME87_00670, partial [Verrucomicrobia bacterium]